MRLGAAWSDVSSQGRLRATGEDRARLLHAISSNSVEGLTPGQGAYAFFLDAQGRIQSDSRIFVDRGSILIACEAEAKSALMEHVEGYIIMDDVALEDIGGAGRVLAVLGPKSREAVAAVSGAVPDDPLTFARADGVIRVFRVPVGETDGYWIEAPAEREGQLVAALEAHGAVPATEAELEALRVENLVPRFGTDFGPENIPHETQQLNAVSFTKGCYTGQEIVERVRSQGQVRRLLVGLELESSDVPSDLTVYLDGSPVGTMTSPTVGEPPGGRARGFAIVRREAAQPGTPVTVGPSKGWVRDAARK